MAATKFLERIGGKRSVRPVSFRVSETTREEGERIAAAGGLTIGQLARQLLLARLRPASAPTPEPSEIKVFYDE